MIYPRVVCVCLQLYPVTDKNRAQEDPDHEIRTNTELRAHFITSSVPSKDTCTLNEHQCVFRNAGELEIVII